MPKSYPSRIELAKRLILPRIVSTIKELWERLKKIGNAAMMILGATVLIVMSWNIYAGYQAHREREAIEIEIRLLPSLLKAKAAMDLSITSTEYLTAKETFDVLVGISHLPKNTIAVLRETRILTPNDAQSVEVFLRNQLVEKSNAIKPKYIVIEPHNKSSNAN